MTQTLAPPSTKDAWEYAKKNPTSAQIQIDRGLCKQSLGTFVRKAWPTLEPMMPYVHGRVIDCMVEHLEAVTAGQITRLLLNVPPGMMKSLLTSVLWPAWEWGPKGMAHFRYVGVAHELGLAVRDASKMRRLVHSDWYQERWPHVKISADQDAKLRFENTATGFRVAKSSTGITGERGDRVIFDDPHSVQAANSDAMREEVVQNFREAVNTRVNDPKKSAIVVIMQRLHENDVSGSILDLGGWEHVCLPMRYDQERKFKSSIATDWRDDDGELLFPERFPEEQVDILENTLGPYAAASQLQQDPKPRTAGLFDVSKLEIVDQAPVCIRWVRAWDFAASVVIGTKKPDWSVGLKMGMTRDRRFVIAGVNRFRKGPADVDAELSQTAKLDGKGVRISLPQDPGQAGKHQIGYFTRALAGYTVMSSPETGSKIVRAEPLAAQVGAGNVMLVQGEWNQAFMDEMKIFPAGSHDDQVDAASRAFGELVNGKWLASMPTVTARTF